MPAGDGHDHRLASPETSAQALKRFRQVFTAVRAHFQQVEKRVGIGGAQVWALGVIGDHPGIGIGGLSRAMHIHQSTASNLVRGLVDRGLVSTERDTVDRRAVRLRLLAAGQSLLEKAPGPYAGLLPQALQQLDDGTLQRLEADLALLLRTMGVADDAPALPIAQL